MMALLILFLILPISALSQTKSGHVVDAVNGSPLAYVNIGIIGANVGTVSDENGQFKIQTTGQPPNAKVRFSIIGYEPKVITLQALKQEPNKIKLSPVRVELEELNVVVSALKKSKLGTRSSSKIMVTGWSKNLKGGERGLRVKVNNKPIYVTKLHFYLVNNEYDNVLMRLHFRRIQNNVPTTYLVNEDILFPVKQESGWVEVDLEPYNLKITEDMAVTLQPVKKQGICTKKNERCLLISLEKFKVFNTNWFYAKTTSEASWIIKKHWSPSIYLTVYE